MNDTPPTSQALFVDWNAYAAQYDRAWANVLTWELATTIQALLSPGMRVLDVGAGTGLVTSQLAAAGWSVVATEPNHYMAKALRARMPDALISEIDLTGSLKMFAAGDFDALVCTNVIQFLNESERTSLITECARISHEGGVVILSAPSDLCTRGRIRRELAASGKWGQLWRFERAHSQLSRSGVISAPATPDPLAQIVAEKTLTTSRGLQRLAVFGPLPYHYDARNE